MSRLRSIIDPGLHSALPLHYPDSVTIQVNSPTRDSKGQPIAGYANLANHVGLKCAISERGSTERRQIWGSYPDAEKLVALAGHYSSIDSTVHFALIDSVRYDILAVLHDSQSASTYLPIRKVR